MYYIYFIELNNSSYTIWLFWFYVICKISYSNSFFLFGNNRFIFRFSTPIIFLWVFSIKQTFRNGDVRNCIESVLMENERTKRFCRILRWLATQASTTNKLKNFLLLCRYVILQSDQNRVIDKIPSFIVSKTLLVWESYASFFLQSELLRKPISRFDCKSFDSCSLSLIWVESLGAFA